MSIFRALITRFFLSSFFLFLPLFGYAENWRWSGVEQIVAVSDIHGAYEAFVDLLQHAGVVDDKLDWQGSKTHLVIVGDVLDRGTGSRQVLDLIMKLENQAEYGGGKVHLILGNHEVMNLVGDLAYVSEGEYTSYADDEDPAERQAAFARFKNINADKDVDEAVLIHEFDKKFPGGFFGHRELFSAHGRYGQWLLDKPVLLHINDTVFVHGGLSKAILGTDGSGINGDYAQVLREYLDNWAVLSGAGILQREADFYDHGKLLKAYLDSQSTVGVTAPDHIQRSAQRLIALNASPLFQTQSLIWYRGNVGCNEVLAQAGLDAALERLDAARLVIGHTPTYNHEVLSRLNGKLIRADTGMLSSHYGGQASAIIIKSGKVAVLYPGQDRTVVPGIQPRQTGARPGTLTDDELAILLMQAPVREHIKQKDGSLLLRLEYHGSLFDALFTPALIKRKNKMFIPEVAAYRLDRLLGIDMVPVTVIRTVDGEPGAVRIKPGYLISEQTRRDKRQGGGAWCPLRDQFNLMYVFDILVHNKGRSPEEMHYTSSDWHLVLTGNRRLFAARAGRPRYLEDTPVSLSAGLIARLKALDEGQLTRKLGDVLDRKRLLAILKRRDKLLETAVKDD